MFVSKYDTNIFSVVKTNLDPHLCVLYATELLDLLASQSEYVYTKKQKPEVYTMKATNSLGARIQRNLPFFTHLLTGTQARKILTAAQKQFPEAIEYEPYTGRLYFSNGSDGWFRWVELEGKQAVFRVMYVPGCEEDE